ncbi:CHAD domain-containing protein [Solitalea lacus]|uniref:CHAD domain-containing protein n=1 Tax=Solitalea lacus TaxID=2911172 RepID=UPI001EDC6EC0|nr:CHAD domain-containing protein [Solitalea lacus]UKJ06083.1 CHAD domain-containing protein [Solitalea lacus]
MGTEKIISATISSQLYQAIDETQKECSNDHLHTLRLNLKKIKALCILFANNNNEHQNSKALFLPFKRLFRHSGRLRDNFQLEKRLIHYFTEDEKLINCLQDKLHNRKEKLTVSYLNKAENFEHEKAASTLDYLSFHLDVKSPLERLGNYKTFTRLRLASVEEQVLQGPNKGQLHHIRAQLKHILMLYKILNVVSNRSNLITQIDNLQEELGNLHDFELLYHYVNEHIEEESKHRNISPILLTRIHSLNDFIEKLRINCLKKLTLLMNNSHF